MTQPQILASEFKRYCQYLLGLSTFFMTNPLYKFKIARLDI